MKSRRVASKWWSSHPLPNMIIIRMVMEPLRWLMAELLSKFQTESNCGLRAELRWIVDRFGEGFVLRLLLRTNWRSSF